MAARLTSADDYFLHQTPYTMDTVYTANPDFRERKWLSISDSVERNSLLSCGIGHYPNLNVQEAWAGITIGDRQYNFRASRHLRPDIQKMAVGPFRVEPLEPLRKIRYVLDENPSGVAFDVTFETMFDPHIEAHHFDIRDGKIVHDLTRYNMTGRAEGVASYPGGNVRIEPDKWFGGRDQSWGVQPDQRSSQPTDKVSKYGTLYTLCYAQFGEWSAFFYMMERMPGIYDYLSGSVTRRLGRGAEKLRIVSVDHEYRWRRRKPVLEAEGVHLTLTTEDGAKHAFDAEFYKPRYFLRSGLYLGWKGWWQGTDKGPLHVEGDVWDLSDDKMLPEYAVAGAGYDHHAVCVSDAGEKGHAAFEYFMTPEYSKYKD